MSSLRAPDSRPLTFRSEISQGIARRRVGNMRAEQKEKSARLAKGRASATKPLTALSKQQRSLTSEKAMNASWPDTIARRSRLPDFDQWITTQVTLQRETASHVSSAGVRRLTGSADRMIVPVPPYFACGANR